MKITSIFLAMLLSAFAFAKTSNQVWRMPSSGNLPAWGQVNLGSTAAVTGKLPAANVTFVPPTVQFFASTGSPTGYFFNCNSGTTASAGATYTNNGVTFTVISSVTSDVKLWTTSSGAPTSSGTLTKTSGTGIASITFTSEVPLANYVLPTNPSPLYLKVRIMGAGGGASGSGTSATTAGNAGGLSTFGGSMMYAQGGSGGGSASSLIGGAGGNASLGTLSQFGISLIGGAGHSAEESSSSDLVLMGASSPWGGAGAGTTTLGGSAVGFTGSGGAGAGTNGSAGLVTGAGGGAGGYAEALVTGTLLSVYPYAVGVAGAGGAAGVSGANGGSGGSGMVWIEEYYQ
jgi:hypothetical protein